MAEKIATNNIIELPLTDTPTHEDDYDRENRTLLVDMDKEEANDPEANANNHWMLIAVTILVVIMTISYFGYDWYQQHRITESAASVAAIESTPSQPEIKASTILASPINENNTLDTPVINSTPAQPERTQPTVKASVSPGQDLLSLINTGTPSIELNNPPSAVKNDTPLTTTTESPSKITTENTLPSQAAPTQSTQPGTTVVPDAMLTQLQTTIDNLVVLTGELKNSMSELTFQVDQNSARIAQANNNIGITMARLEKLEKGKIANKTTITSKPKTSIQAKKSKTTHSWIDQSSVVSVRKIGSSFIAKIRTPSGVVRLSVGDQHQGWTVNKIDLNNGAVKLQHQKGQQRSLSL